MYLLERVHRLKFSQDNKLSQNTSNLNVLSRIQPFLSELYQKTLLIHIERQGLSIYLVVHLHVRIVGIIAVNMRNITVKKTQPALLITFEASLPMS